MPNRKYLCPAYLGDVDKQCGEELPCHRHNVRTPAMSYIMYGRMLVELTQEEANELDD